MAYPDEWNDVLKELETLRAENERLREALKIISNAKETMRWYTDKYALQRCTEIAQEALKEVKE